MNTNKLGISYLKLWEGLGYYRRARNLLATSKILVQKYNSKLPFEIKEIKKLPGIGDYTANALFGLVHNRPTIAVDGNVKRIFARILNKEVSKKIAIRYLTKHWNRLLFKLLVITNFGFIKFQL